MNKIIKGLCIATGIFGCTVSANAEEKGDKDGFMRRAFRDMKESAKLQRQIDRANFQAVKLESKAFYQEQKRLSNPSARSAAEKERMQKELEAANLRVAEAQEKVDALKK